MIDIGGNITASIQICTGTTKNDIGESVKSWETVHSPTGYLDYLSGDSKYVSYNAKIQASTHVFVCSYFQLNSRVKAESARVLIGSDVYDIMVIDDPMGLGYQLEIYLKYTGGQ